MMAVASETRAGEDAVDVFPLSFAQQRLWFLNRLEGPSATYNVPVVVRMVGAVDVPALWAAVHDLVERHEILRTVFREIDGEPRQCVLPPDGTGRAETTIEVDRAAFDATLETVVGQPFDLAEDLPLRTTLLRLAADEHVLALVVHHVACDGWSLAPLLNDLSRAYNARRQGTAPDWAPLPVRYSDYTLWHRELLGRDDDPDSLGNRQLRYWREALAGLPEEMPLPVTRPRPTADGARPDGQPTSGGTIEYTVGPGLHARLVTTGRRHGCTVFMLLQAAVAVVLTRHGAGTDIVFGTPVSGRTDEALDDLVGFFVNTLVLRTDTSGDPTFAEVLGRVRRANLDAYPHQDIPFERLVGALNPDRSLSRHPLFQVMLALNEGWPGGRLRLDGLRSTLLRQTTGTAKFSLSVDFEDRRDPDDRPAGLRVLLEYATGLFDESVVRSLADQLIRLLDVVTGDPTVRVRAVPLLTAADRRRQVVRWGGPRTPETMVDLADRVRRYATAQPDLVALSDGEVRYTYRDLADRVDRISRALSAAGAGPDDLTAILADRSTWFVVAALGALGAGSGYLALDGTLPVDRAADMLADSGTQFLLAAPGGTDRARAVLSRTAAQVTLVPTDLSGPAAPAPEAWHPAASPPHPGALAYVVFTSGSTGRPKGALIPHRGLWNHLLAVIDLYGLDQRDVMAFNAPLTFDVAVWQALTMPLAGGRVHVLDDDTTRDPLALVRCVADEGVTVLQIVPQVLRAILEMWDLDPSTVDTLRGLRWMLVHGEELPPELVDRWFARHPDIPLANVYGPAECSDDVSISVIRADDPYRRSLAPIGRLLRNTRAYVLDDHLQLLPVGVVGELYVTGAGLARGYAGRPDLTAQRFLPDPYGRPGDRMYRTGDLARWNADGELEFAGRVDHQVKVRGFRIEPGEVLAVVERDPAVRQAFVMAVPGRGGDRVLVAYVVPAAGQVVDGAAVRRAAGRHLPEHMVPTFVVPVDELPVTVNGKVDRRALPALDVAAPVSSRPARTPQEQLLCEVFAEALGLSTVGAEDSFFDLGGHSMLAMRLLARIRSLTGVPVTIRHLYEAPTPAGLLRAAGPGTGSDDRDPLLPLRAGSDPQALFCVHPATGLAWSYAGMAAHLPAGTPVYGLQAPGLLPGSDIPADLDDMLDRMLTELCRVQPRGPYRLLGWSLGGNLAHALAGRLQAAGEEVDLLALIDAYPGETWPYPPGVTARQWDEFSLLSTLAPAPPGAVDATGDAFAAVLAGLRVAAREQLGVAPDLLERLVTVGVNASQLVATHRPRRVTGRMVHVTATLSRGPTRPGPAAWEPYVDLIDRRDLECRHEEAMDPGPRRQVAEVITAELRGGPRRNGHAGIGSNGQEGGGRA